MGQLVLTPLVVHFVLRTRTSGRSQHTTKGESLKMIASVAQIESSMYLIRGQKIMLSQHLAELYEVEPRVLNQAVKRNLGRFPEDFMFQLSPD